MKIQYRFDSFNVEALEAVKHILNRPSYTWLDHETKAVMKVIEALEIVVHHAPVEGKSVATRLPQYLVKPTQFAYKKVTPSSVPRISMFFALGMALAYIAFISVNIWLSK